jgi:hypothetical protein
MTTQPRDFKKNVLEYKTRIFTNSDMPEPRHVGVFAMTQVIPKMEKNKEVAFLWNGSDVLAMEEGHYAQALTMFKNQKLKKTNGDTTWFYDFKTKEGTRRCVMTTEIWYDDKKEWPLSPFAILFSQFIGNGIHITKCKFVAAD